MDKPTPATSLISPAFFPTRRRMLGGALALLGLGAAARIVPASLLAKLPFAGGDGFVIIDGWVLPARYFQD